MVPRPRFSVLACSVLISVLLATPLSAIYVDPVNGDDSRSGDSWETAIKTITEATKRRAVRAVYLSEGVFCRESGEDFPICFTEIPSVISGASPDTSIIDAGSGSTILCSLWDSDRDCVITDVCFRSQGDTAFASAEGPMLLLRCDNLTLERSSFENYASLTEPVLALSTRYSITLSFSDCRFVDCCGQWLSGDWDEFACAGLLIKGCSFVTSSLRVSSVSSDNFPPFVSQWARVEGSRFEGPGSFLGLDVSRDLTYINCAFEDQRLQVFPGDPIYHAGGVYWPNRDFLGCSFKNSVLEVDGTVQGVDMEVCVFDSASELVVTDGCVFLRACCSPFVDDDDKICIGWRVEGSPMFVDGPLGGCYLSNPESGQMFSSPCISHRRERYRDWPPSGSTTRTDGVVDEAPYDIGFHYPSVPPPPPVVAVRTDRAEYAAGEEMQAFMSYENRGVKVEGAIYFAFAPDTLDWFIYWPRMTFVPTPWVEGTLYSGVSYPNLPPTTHTIPEGLAPGAYLWLGAIIGADGAFASDIAVCPVTITAH